MRHLRDRARTATSTCPTAPRPHAMPPGAMVVVTCVRVSTPSRRTSSRPCAPVLADRRRRTARRRCPESMDTVCPAIASTPAARSFCAKASSTMRLRRGRPTSPTTTILRMGGPAKSCRTTPSGWTSTGSRRTARGRQRDGKGERVACVRAWRTFRRGASRGWHEARRAPAHPAVLAREPRARAVVRGPVVLDRERDDRRVQHAGRLRQVVGAAPSRACGPRGCRTSGGAGVQPNTLHVRSVGQARHLRKRGCRVPRARRLRVASCRAARALPAAAGAHADATRRQAPRLAS